MPDDYEEESEFASRDPAYHGIPDGYLDPNYMLAQ